MGRSCGRAPRAAPRRHHRQQRREQRTRADRSGRADAGPAAAVLMRVDVQTPRGLAWADLERPGGKPVALLAIGHGAGGGVDAPDLLAVRDAALGAHLAVARITQPYRVAGRRAPAPAAHLDEAWLAAVACVRRQRGLGTLPLVVLGRSSGARVA